MLRLVAAITALVVSLGLSGCTASGKGADVRSSGAVSSSTNTSLGADTTSSTSGSSVPSQPVPTSFPIVVGGTIPPPAGGWPTTTKPSLSPVTDSPTGAIEMSLTSSDTASIMKAFGEYMGFTQCPLVPVTGTFRAATITSTGVSWAFGQATPQSGCTVQTSSGVREDPVASGLWSDSAPSNAGVFERQPGGDWVMNSNESEPFPCPDNLSSPYTSPGPSSPYVPSSVLNAVGVTYAASGCGDAFTPQEPR